MGSDSPKPRQVPMHCICLLALRLHQTEPSTRTYSLGEKEDSSTRQSEKSRAGLAPALRLQQKQQHSMNRLHNTTEREPSGTGLQTLRPMRFASRRCPCPEPRTRISDCILTSTLTNLTVQLPPQRAQEGQGSGHCKKMHGARNRGKRTGNV